MPRRPLPAALKLLRGVPGHRKLPKNPALPPGIPPCPKHLRGLARTTWHRVGQLLAQLGVVTAVDQDAIELLVRSYVEHHKAQTVLDRLGMTYTIKTASGRVVRARPEVAIVADAARRLKGMLIEFGLTPSARARLDTAPAPAEGLTNVEAFLFGDRKV